MLYVVRRLMLVVCCLLFVVRCVVFVVCCLLLQCVWFGVHLACMLYAHVVCCLVFVVFVVAFVRS